ncbi:glutaredoxin family protein [Cupriavidus sp. AU9028]|uniref:glutaredoxin family protein n=1 Tax=Cupriavidus sp. AU9028 TaxID=2871157 RepID=UPI001C966481|nr:glutaredoxin family protein [Cupriavidus sp. AU9028]MBY4898615.1 glutaredoxin family protein [Cupriavidus sp. AU9028]
MAQASTPHILIYSTPTCPDCRALKEWLSQQGIAFEDRNRTDPKTSAEAKSRTGVRVVPRSPPCCGLIIRPQGGAELVPP